MPLTNKQGQTILLGSRTSATAAITSTETVVQSARIEANTLAAGDVLRIKYNGNYAATVAGTATYRNRFGTAGTTADAAVLTSVSAAGGTAAVSCIGEMWWTVRAVGSSGTMIGAHHGIGPPAGTAVGPNSLGATVTINTTVTNFISLTCQMSVATANLTFHQCFFELIRP